MVELFKGGIWRLTTALLKSTITIYQDLGSEYLPEGNDEDVGADGSHVDEV